MCVCDVGEGYISCVYVCGMHVCSMYMGCLACICDVYL